MGSLYNWKTGLCSFGIACALLLGGCGTSGGDHSGETAGTGADNPSKDEVVRKDLISSTEPVTITFYRPNTGTTEEQFNNIIGNSVKAKYPNVTPKFIPFDSKLGIEGVLTSGSDLDIVLLSIGFVTQYPNFNLQYDMSQYIATYDYDLNRLESTSVDFIRNFGKGEMYALPVWSAAVALMYNEDLFDKFGVPYPRNGMKWDEAYDLATRMTRVENGQNFYGLLMTNHTLRTNQLSQPFVDPATNQPLLEHDLAKKLIDNFSRFYRVGVPFEKRPNEASLFVQDRTLAMYAFFHNTMLTAPKEMNINAVTLPTFAEKPSTGPQMYPTYAGVASISKNKEYAFQIIAHLTSDEMQLKFAQDGTGLPVIKNNKQALEAVGQGELKAKNIQAFIPNNPAPIPLTDIYEDIGASAFNGAFNEVLLGQSDRNSALRTAQEKAIANIEAAMTAAKK